MKLLKDFGVRALLGTLVVAPTSITLCILASRGSTEALVMIGEMATMAVGFYFGQRSIQKSNEGGSNVESTK